MSLVAQALFFALPVIAAGAAHIAVIRAGALAALARVALDGGLRLRGRRLFGANKTLRGLVVMPLASALVAAAAAQIPGAAAVAVVPAQLDHPLLWGAALGAGYLLGELPNSLLKRQIDIAPGDVAMGPVRVFFGLFDQVDSLLGVCLVARAFGPVPLPLVVALLVVTLVVHPLAGLVMVLLGLKRRVG